MNKLELMKSRVSANNRGYPKDYLFLCETVPGFHDRAFVRQHRHGLYGDDLLDPSVESVLRVIDAIIDGVAFEQMTEDMQKDYCRILHRDLDRAKEAIWDDWNFEYTDDTTAERMERLDDAYAWFRSTYGRYLNEACDGANLQMNELTPAEEDDYGDPEDHFWYEREYHC